MKATKAASGGLVLAAVLGWTWVGYQQVSLAHMREREQRVAERLNPGRDNPRPAADQPPVQPTPAPSTAPLSREERLELMRLRSQVTDLRERQRKQFGLTNELGQLQAQWATVTNLASGLLPAGWVRRKDARLAGFASPQAAFESFLWAVERRDTNALRQAVSRDTWEAVQEQLNAANDSFWREAEHLPGFLFRSASTQPDGRVRLLIDVAPGVSGPPMMMEFREGGWRLAEM